MNERDPSGDAPVPSFGEAMAELEQILERIEGEEVDVDGLAAELRRASELLELARDKIRRAEVDDDDDDVKTRPTAVMSAVELDESTVRHIGEIGDIAGEMRIAIGIIATPASAAQEVADRLIAAGVTSILNFAPTIVTVPPEVSLRKVDLAVELQILSFYQQRRGSDRPVLPPGATMAPPSG